MSVLTRKFFFLLLSLFLFLLKVRGSLSKYERLYSHYREIFCTKQTTIKQSAIQRKKKKLVLFGLCAGSYDGEIVVWNSSTEKALKKLRPHGGLEDYKNQQGLIYKLNNLG